MGIATLDRAASLNRWRHRALSEKALIGLGFLLLAVLLPPWPGALLSGLAVIGFTFLGARVPLRLWLGAVALPLGFLASGVLVLMLRIDAQGIGLSPEGLDRALPLTLRAMAGSVCLLFLALTTPAAQLVAGLRWLRVPPEIVDLALLIYRFVFLIGAEAMAMTAAQQARLGHATRRGRLRSTGQVIARMLPRALDRARRMEQGLAARGWQGEMPVLAPVQSASATMLALILSLQALTLAAGIWL